MEHIFDWLFALLKSKIMHAPFFAGFCITLKNKKENGVLDFGDLGDNVPYVFLKGN